MDLGTIQEYFLPHWPFFFMSFALGFLVQFAKKKVWTKERAAKNGFFKFMNGSLGIHAPIIGAIAGLCGFPVSPGVEGPLARALYHFVAGIISAWVVAAFKKFMKSRGICPEDK